MTFSSVINASTSSQIIEVAVQPIYEINFSTANVTGAILPDDDTGVKVGEVSITCNAAAFDFRAHCSSGTYIDAGTVYLVKLGGAASVADERIEYKVYFPDNSGTLGHTDPGLPKTAGTAAAITGADTGYDYAFTAGGVTDLTWDVSIVSLAADVRAAEIGTYQSEITLTIVAP